MFVAFYADAYFSLGGEVLLYFIEQVEVVQFKFDLNSNWFGM
jgi:hypothetical protein